VGIEAYFCFWRGKFNVSPFLDIIDNHNVFENFISSTLYLPIYRLLVGLVLAKLGEE